MRGSDRVFRPGAIQHIYQNTVDGSLIFYSVKDYLVLFSLISIASRRYHVTVIGICMMPDHVHLLAIADKLEDLSRFVCYYTSIFVKYYNPTVNRNGQVFRHSFGSAMKVDDKRIRFAIAYLYNNLVEKQLATNVESSRWNFIRYAVCSCPFSEPVNLATASRALRRAMEFTMLTRQAERPLTYNMITRITRPLTDREKRQLTDYTIRQYNCIDYSTLIGFFGSYDAMVTVFNTTTGVEYGVGEVHHKESDAIYAALTRLLLHRLPVLDIKEIFFLDEPKRRDLALTLARETRAPMFQIKKYLHLPLD